MKQTIPFVKELQLKTMINEITSISLEHNLSFTTDKNIVGDFLLGGTYKVSETSVLQENFDEKIPVLITIDDKYDINNAKIIIDDFYYELLNNNTIKLNIELSIEGLSYEEILEKKQEEIEESFEEGEIEEISETLKKEEAVLKEELRDEEIVTDGKIDSLFANLSDNDESFATYSVYIMRSGDSIEDLINQYQVTLEELKNYNDLENVQVGSKIIIPNYTNE
ncbi:MAG: LysM peptidoglycan-binding domain-containing protein [Tenericutes bacterium]|jgi:LysM repeat protein|nr:LysM peptidoglycan-binding domain-containing protein [Mycoplasmatota bacterium]